MKLDRRIVLGWLLASAPLSACADPVSARIYPAPTAPLSLAGLQPEASLFDVTTRDGLKLQGVQVAARVGMPTLLIFHGNASSASGVVQWFEPMVKLGYGLVSAEYRGYSGSPGAPSEPGLTADADAFYDHARQAAGAGPLWIVGHSLGGGVALALAQRRPAELVLTIGAFQRLRVMVPALLRGLVPDAYVNEAVAPTLTVPYFLVHGTADDVVPWPNGEALHKRASAAGREGASFVVLGAGHAPDAAVLARIFEAVRTRPADAPPSAAGLPANVKLIPFGQGRPAAE